MMYEVCQTSVQKINVLYTSENEGKQDCQSKVLNKNVYISEVYRMLIWASRLVKLKAHDVRLKILFERFCNTKKKGFFLRLGMSFIRDSKVKYTT